MKSVYVFVMICITFYLQPSSFEALKDKYKIQRSHYCAYYNKVSELEELVGNDISSLNSVDIYGNSPLHYASYYNRKGVVEFLLGKGVYVDIKNNLGDTPLFLAVLKGNQDIMILLCEHHADINNKNNDGLPPFKVSDEHHQEIMNTVSVLCHNPRK